MNEAIPELCLSIPPFAFEKLPSRENEQGLMANATEMPSFKMLCTNNNEFTGGAAQVAAAAAHSVKSGSLLANGRDWRLSSGLSGLLRLWESVTVG